ncbi:hypothetical protein NDU88_006087 [Pleurodeles waltl]|uniref:Uncharacterized protein n=1 Tax=Pleurodeles waltl TaxID=8319 RepID=A0AAV7MEV4_PLEWA|nr:hypothetical protein NDU88_006087 [Pleurodeles waltl]
MKGKVPRTQKSGCASLTPAPGRHGNERRCSRGRANSTIPLREPRRRTTGYSCLLHGRIEGGFQPPLGVS